MTEDKTKLTQELQKQIEEGLEDYREMCIYENIGGGIVSVHRDREIVYETLNGLYSLICEIGKLKPEKEG